MVTVIAGSRGISDYEVLKCAVANSGFDITEVVQGGARGVDLMAARWAYEHGVPMREFAADWNTYGRAAGMIRNEIMAQYASMGDGGLIAVWDGGSPGTRNMIDQAERYGLQVYVYLHSGQLGGCHARRKPDYTLPYE